MNEIACKDLLNNKCSYKATGEGADDIMDSMVMHMMEAHPEKSENMSENAQQELTKKINDALDS